MEPFISPDGRFLFFNDSKGPTGKDLFYAEAVSETEFVFRRALRELNTPAVDGVPTVDAESRFFYISTFLYRPPNDFDTVFHGQWTGSGVEKVRRLKDLARPEPGIVIFDVEVSRDGSTLYLSEGDFSGGGGMPLTADLFIAVRSGNGYVRMADSDRILANINTADLEYAAAISADGLELFFTRFQRDTGLPQIFRATRTSPSAPFGPPQRVQGVEGFVEAPALSPDGRSLYYHRRDPTTGRFQIMRVTRP